jgi:hypothetical protein
MVLLKSGLQNMPPASRQQTTVWPHYNVANVATVLVGLANWPHKVCFLFWQAWGSYNASMLRCAVRPPVSVLLMRST